MQKTKCRKNAIKWNTYRHVAAHFFDGIIGGALDEDVAEQRLDAHGARVVLHGHLVDVQRLQRGHSQLRQAVDQKWSEVIEGAADAHVDLRIVALARLNVHGYLDAEKTKSNRIKSHLCRTNQTELIASRKRCEKQLNKQIALSLK